MVYFRTKSSGLLEETGIKMNAGERLRNGKERCGAHGKPGEGLLRSRVCWSGTKVPGVICTAGPQPRLGRLSPAWRHGGACLSAAWQGFVPCSISQLLIYLRRFVPASHPPRPSDPALHPCWECLFLLHALSALTGHWASARGIRLFFLRASVPDVAVVYKQLVRKVLLSRRWHVCHQDGIVR